VERAQQLCVFLGQAQRQRSELAPQRLEGRNGVRRRLHPFCRDRDQRNGNAECVGGQPASILVPEMAQEGAECVRFDKARQIPNLIERNAGRSRRARGRMNMSSLQAKAKRCQSSWACSLGERIGHPCPSKVFLSIRPKRSSKLLARNAPCRSPV